jgi:hypothetical protein
LKKLYIFIIFTILQLSCLEAGGWGKTEEVVEFEKAAWNGVYFDMEEMNLTAAIPNYSGAIFRNGEISVRGKVEPRAAYIITTSYNPEYEPPQTIDEFIVIVQEVNPDFYVTVNASYEFGAKYAIDLVPIKQEDLFFWRFLCTNNRLIKMGTNDANEARRTYFFNNIKIR